MKAICSRGRAVDVIGSTGHHYTVRFAPTDTTCTCAGFHYRRSCKHLPLGAELRCTWRSEDDKPQEIPGACPACGAATIEVPTVTPPGIAPLSVAVIVTIGGSPSIDADRFAYRIVSATGPTDPIVCLPAGRRQAAPPHTSPRSL